MLCVQFYCYFLLQAVVSGDALLFALSPTSVTPKCVGYGIRKSGHQFYLFIFFLFYVNESHYLLPGNSGTG